MLVHDDVDVVNANEEVVAKAASTNKSKAARPPLLFIVFLLVLLLSIMYDGRSNTREATMVSSSVCKGMFQN